MTKSERMSLATRLAQTHRGGDLIFWTAEDWSNAQVVHCIRLDPERVRIQVRSIGPVALDPGVQIRN